MNSVAPQVTRPKLCRRGSRRRPTAIPVVHGYSGRCVDAARAMDESFVGYAKAAVFSRHDGVDAAPERCGGRRGVSRPHRRRAWHASRRYRCKGAALGAGPDVVPLAVAYATMV